MCWWFSAFFFTLSLSSRCCVFELISARNATWYMCTFVGLDLVCPVRFGCGDGSHCLRFVDVCLCKLNNIRRSLCTHPPFLPFESICSLSRFHMILMPADYTHDSNALFFWNAHDFNDFLECSWFQCLFPRTKSNENACSSREVMRHDGCQLTMTPHNTLSEHSLVYEMAFSVLRGEINSMQIGLNAL